MPAFRRILIANRGEIAVRVIRTCREMGIETVAVYSDFDRDALHVRLADLAVRIGAPPPRDSYLNIEAILAAAKRTAADAIHPGYGFLAENADFATACEHAGIAFIGPRSDVIRAMGSKNNARRLAEEAGVPVVPQPAAGEFPVLIKASAGGGGRGMRIVHNESELQPAMEAARGEAERAFGDGTLLLEKYIEGARHIEIQILGDHHGRLIQLFERDCSIQRRYQKIVEESPAPGITPELRDGMADAALALGRRLGYTNAGTVEFLLAPTGEFYFIEVNTRIQVEHPVTEMITGLDLVRLQIEIAEGRPLPADPPHASGHAIEARLYAEQPENNFLPSTGIVRVWEPPTGVRVDTAIEQGAEIGVYYDPLLAKVIVHAADRETAVRKLVYALRAFAAQGISTNREYLLSLLPALDTAPVHDTLQNRERKRPDAPDIADASIAAIVCSHIEQTEHAARTTLPSIPIGYRNNPYPRPPMKLEIAGHEYAVHPQEPIIDGVHHDFRITHHGDEYYLRSTFVQRTVRRLPRYPRRPGAHEHQSASSPMPGQVLRILVEVGQQVRPGDPLVVLEAMKMEQTIKTTIQGVVEAVLVKVGDIVAPGQMLVAIESKFESGEGSNEHTSGSAAVGG
jgi:propionyl-CoA carboxylase alpha chain